MRIGIDVHGVADLYSEFFKKFSKTMIDNGNSVHIITGQEWEKVKPTVDKYNISYDAHFSIVDYHRSIGTDMWKDARGTWWMAEKIWMRSKGDYMQREHIDVHFDDSYQYAEYVPKFCTYVLVPPEGFGNLTWLFSFINVKT